MGQAMQLSMQQSFLTRVIVHQPFLEIFLGYDSPVFYTF